MEFFKRLLGRITFAGLEEKRDFAEYTQRVLSEPSLPGCDEKKGYALHDTYMN